MTVRKHLKRLVRERMTKTGECYTTSRRQVLRHAPGTHADPALRWHFPGNVPAATALRVLLAHAGVVDPRTSMPFSEAMVFGIAGGIGVGVCAFRYAKEDFSSFFIAGRHLWVDDAVYLTQAAGRFGLTASVQETGGGKTADKQLRAALADGPCIAWVDMAQLPHRALPAMWQGGCYHVVTMYKIDGDRAWIGDLTDAPVAIPLGDLAKARGRIKKQKHRLLTVGAGHGTPDLRGLVRDGLAACRDGLTRTPKKGYPNMFSLDAFATWAERIGAGGEHGWATIFPRGANLWRCLTSMHQFIDHYGTGGGLCRPLFAEFLEEAGKAGNDPRLRKLAGTYAGIGEAWSALAKAALPDDVPLLRQARACHVRYAELFAGSGSVDEKRAVWAELDQLAARAQDDFPLSERECADLRQQLQHRVQALVVQEQEAFAELSSVVDVL
ncbi:MAG: BtrH N-terminal domain-containing protein [Gemmataceae bacterium]|nr:BtrH N-terminal domain-containing protein [Gemmataceae bacterium]